MSITGLGSAFDCYMMNSYHEANKVIKLFESAVAQGYNPVEVEQEVWNKAGVDPATLLDTDKKRIQLRVNEIWESNCRYRG